MKVRWTNNFPSNDNYKWKQWFSWLYTRFTAFKWKTWWHMSKYIFVYILCLRKHSIIDSESINSSSKFRITTFSFGKCFIKYKYGEVRSTKILYWFPDYFNREKLKIKNTQYTRKYFARILPYSLEAMPHRHWLISNGHYRLPMVEWLSCGSSTNEDGTQDNFSTHFIFRRDHCLYRNVIQTWGVVIQWHINCRKAGVPSSG